LARPDIAELAACLDRLAVLEDRGVQSTSPQYRAINVYIAGQHRDLIASPATWSAPVYEHWELGNQRRARAEGVVASWPDPQKADVADAARILTPFFDRVKSEGERL